MSQQSIRKSWNEAFPNALPTGYLCRAGAYDRWFRTHSLPESKRYPDTDGERVEVLRRYNAVASQVLGEHEKCILFAARFGDGLQLDLESNSPLAQLGLSHVFGESTDDDQIQFFATRSVWRSGAFDPLLVAVADDQTGPILFFNPSRRSAFAPYDGGSDIFLESADLADRMKKSFSSWLSSHPGGL